MPFDAGRITFARFHVDGDAPTRVDDAALDILSQFAFRETPIGTPDEVETGFITGQHVFDTQFNYEKNAYGANSDLLLFALRMDTHKVPADIKRAYKQINEQALADGSNTGVISRHEKREARETAQRQINEDLASGKFRRTKSVPLLWDLSRKEILCGAVGNAVTEQLVSMMRQAFEVTVSPLSGGALIGRLAGSQRDHEDARPSAFTAPPAGMSADLDEEEGLSGPKHDDSIPSIPWAAGSFETRDFLGNEMLIWLWHAVQEDGGLTIDKTELSLAIDKLLDLECAWGVTGKTSLRGAGPNHYPEARDAIRIGKWPRKLSLILHDGEFQFEFAYQGDRAIVSSLAIPPIEDAQSPRELVEQRLGLVRAFITTWDLLVGHFAQLRLSSQWSSQRNTIREWIKAMPS